MPTLTLDENHVYRLDGVKIPGVTEILDSVGLISPFAKNGEAAERGTLVHECCALLANDRLDWATVDPRLLGYVMSFAEFLKTQDAPLLYAEEPVYHRDYLYAGTYDMLFPGVLVDLKTGSPARWHALQLAAYRACVEPGSKVERWTVYLQPDGSTPKVIEHTDRSDWPNFLSCLNVYRLREGMNGNPGFRD